MKRSSILVWTILASLIISPGINAQKKNQGKRPDSYYLSGAVPERDGKVYFSKQFSLPALSQAEIMEKASAWAKAYIDEIQGGSAILSQDEAAIKAMNHEIIVFSESNFQRDNGGIHYVMEVKAEDQALTLEIHNINFTYPDRGRFTAEEWISDKEALNKDRTKMYPGTAKWRRGTVDFFDELAGDLQLALSQSVTVQSNSTAKENASNVTVINPIVSAPAVTADKKEAEEIVSKPDNAMQQAAQPMPSQVQVSAITSNVANDSHELSLDKITPDFINSKGSLSVLAQSKEATAQMGGYVTREGNDLYVTLMFQPSQDLSFLEDIQSFQIRYTDENGTVTLMECDEASLEKGTRGRPHMLIGTLRKATRP